MPDPPEAVAKVIPLGPLPIPVIRYAGIDKNRSKGKKFTVHDQAGNTLYGYVSLKQKFKIISNHFQWCAIDQLTNQYPHYENDHINT